MNVKWNSRNGDECAGVLHSFLSTPSGIMGMVVTEVGAEGKLGFFMVPDYELEVTELDVKRVLKVKKAKK